MTSNIKFYKIKIIKKILAKTNQAQTQLLDELTANATDPIIVHRRIRMLKHLNLYENQLISKIQNFKTDDVSDLNMFNIDHYIDAIINRSA
jgi:aminoglycoside N3'-acetyltransferase